MKSRSAWMARTLGAAVALASAWASPSSAKTPHAASARAGTAAPAEHHADDASATSACGFGSGADGTTSIQDDGPISVGFTSADFAAARHACPRTELSLAARFGAIIDTPNFYGAIGVDGLLSGSLALSDRFELFATVEAVKYQWVQNAVLKGSTLAFGQTTIGATYAMVQSGGFTLSPSLLLMLPTSFVDRDVRTGGAQLGIAVEDHVLPRLELHGWAGVEGTAGISAAAPYPRAGVALNAGIGFAFFRWFAAVVDVDAHFATRAPLDYLAPALGLRFHIGDALGIQLAGTLPVAGGDRHNALGGLKISYRF